MPETLGSPTNYSFVIDETPRRRARAKVWRRPDLDSATGARLAAELSGHIMGLAARGVREFVFDLREAPPVAGPRTLESLGLMFKSCEAGNVRTAVLVSVDSVQALQIRRLIAEHAPRVARVVREDAEANAWVTGPAPLSTR